MVYVPVESLKPGMVLGRSLPSIFFGVSLLNVNEPFSLRMINKLRKLRIPGVYIKDGLTDDIEIQEIFTPKQMDKLVLGVKKQFDSFASSAVISNESVDDFTAMSGEIVSTVLQSDEILYNMINIKSYDNYTYSHSMMVSLLSVLIGERMGLGQKDLNNVAMAGLMHDIGKVDIPIEIINKNGRLTTDEYDIVKNHPIIAAERLSTSPLIPTTVLRGIKCHHEKYDGSGYPFGVAGKEIPLFGRILAVADVYDALTSKRAYRDPWNSAEAIEYMKSLVGVHFDKEIIDTFFSVVAAYPTGSIVTLSNGYMGIVIKNTQGSTLRPMVRIVEPFAFRGMDMDLTTDSRFADIEIVKTVHDASSYLRDMSATI